MMMISVVMSIYKEPLDWLEQSIGSILKQTFSDFEFILIIDNPGYRDCHEYIDRLCDQDERVKVIRNETNIGLTKSLNRGFEIAKGKYIARMDADDISYLDRFAKQVAFLEKNQEFVACGTGIRKFGRVQQSFVFESDPNKIALYFTVPSPFLSPIAHPTAMIRKSALEENDIKYNESYRTSQDYGLWSELVLVGQLSNLDSVLLDYRTSDTQISRSKREEQLSTASSIIENHINGWLKRNNYSLDSPLSLYSLKNIRGNARNEYDRKMFSTFAFGLLGDSNVSPKEVLKYYISDLGLQISLKMKVKLLAKKLLKK